MKEKKMPGAVSLAEWLDERLKFYYSQLEKVNKGSHEAGYYMVAIEDYLHTKEILAKGGYATAVHFNRLFDYGDYKRFISSLGYEPTCEPEVKEVQFEGLSPEDSIRLVEDILNPPEPTPAYLRAAASYEKLFGKRKEK